MSLLLLHAADADWLPLKVEKYFWLFFLWSDISILSIPCFAYLPCILYSSDSTMWPRWMNTFFSTPPPPSSLLLLSSVDYVFLIRSLFVSAALMSRCSHSSLPLKFFATLSIFIFMLLFPRVTANNMFVFSVFISGTLVTETSSTYVCSKTLCTKYSTRTFQPLSSSQYISSIFLKRTFALWASFSLI